MFPAHFGFAGFIHGIGLGGCRGLLCVQLPLLQFPLAAGAGGAGAESAGKQVYSSKLITHYYQLLSNK